MLCKYTLSYVNRKIFCSFFEVLVLGGYGVLAVAVHPRTQLIEYDVWVSDSNVSPRDTGLESV